MSNWGDTLVPVPFLVDTTPPQWPIFTPSQTPITDFTQPFHPPSPNMGPVVTVGIGKQGWGNAVAGEQGTSDEFGGLLSCAHAPWTKHKNPKLRKHLIWANCASMLNMITQSLCHGGPQSSKSIRQPNISIRSHPLQTHQGLTSLPCHNVILYHWYRTQWRSYLPYLVGLFFQELAMNNLGTSKTLNRSVLGLWHTKYQCLHSGSG